jgi:UDP-N-acetylglucosamine 2-epimerase (non-hydrolysing)
MNDRHKVLVIFGTRPEAIKLAPVIAALAAVPTLEPRVCVTGQHREMLDQMLALFDIRPDHDLDVMRADQDLFDLSARTLTGLRAVLEAERPAAVLVQGDTTTAMAAALAAFYRRIPVGHVEAGLRTEQVYDPFPEEMNRRLTSQLATWHYAPTARAAANLRREGVPAERILMTGNTIVDALHSVVRRLERAPAVPALPVERLAGRRLVLVTGHRRESFGAGLRNICQALRALAERHPEALIVYPVHLNPAVQRPVHEILAGHPGIVLTAPLDYLPFVDLMRRAYLILTDSGGLQEEAPSLGIPVLVMRDTTERPEAIDAGTAALVGTQRDAIVDAASRLLSDGAAHARMRAAVNPFGDGAAAPRIAEHLAGTLRGSLPPLRGKDRMGGDSNDAANGPPILTFPRKGGRDPRRRA